LRNTCAYGPPVARSIRIRASMRCFGQWTRKALRLKRSLCLLNRFAGQGLCDAIGRRRRALFLLLKPGARVATLPVYCAAAIRRLQATTASPPTRPEARPALGALMARHNRGIGERGNESGQLGCEWQRQRVLKCDWRRGGRCRSQPVFHRSAGRRQHRDLHRDRTRP
jgi:hypothetical protein